MDSIRENKYVLVAHNHVAVKPPEYLHPALTKMFEGTMVHPVNSKMFHATIFYSKKPLNTFNPDSKKEYQAEIKDAKIWYDAYVGTTNLIIDILSPDLEKRHEEIATKHNGVDVYSEYQPHLTIVYDIAFTHSRRAILNAFTDYVDQYLQGEKLTLTGEYLESTSGVAKALGLRHD